MERIRFFAPDMRRALHQVLQSLGPRAVIYTSRRVKGGVEVEASEPINQQNQIPEATRANGSVTPVNNVPSQQSSPKTAATANTHVPELSEQDNQFAKNLLQSMQFEISSLKSILKQQTHNISGGTSHDFDPNAMNLLQKLSKLGLQHDLCQHILDQIDADLDPKLAWQQAKDYLTQIVAVNHQELIDQHGIVAMVGPTGVGKTTTIAKLATRFVTHYGHEHLSLITTDSYRVAGREQLKIYGRILNVPVHVVCDEQELAETLCQLSNKRLVLIDTAGISQRDIQLARKLALFNSAKYHITTYVVLSAASQQNVLDETILGFQLTNLAGCIFTKMDETASLGPLMSVCIQHQLPIAYISEGQRVPHDLKIANSVELVQQMIAIAQRYNNDLERDPISAYNTGGLLYA